jgi:PAS domain S-box-containing protein
MIFSFNKKTILVFSIIIILVITSFVININNNEAKTASFGCVQHSRKVIYNLGRLDFFIRDNVIGSLGYAITGDTIFIQPIDSAKENIPLHLNKLIILTSDNQNQQLRLDSLKVLIDKRLNFSFEIIRLRNEKGIVAVQQLMASDLGQEYLHDIRKLINDFLVEENKLLEIRLAKYAKNMLVVKLSFYILLVSVLLLLIFVLFTINHYSLARKNAELALFIKNELYSQTLINLSDGVITTDMDGIITLINKAACQLAGWNEEEVIGNHIDMVFEITNETTELKMPNPLIEAMLKNEIIWLKNHTILKRKDGSHIFIDNSGAPINNQKGEIIGGVLIFGDISERKKAEKELQLISDKLNEAQKLANSGSWESNFITNFNSWSENHYKLLGLNKQEIQPSFENFLSRVHPDDVHLLIERQKNIINNKKGVNIEIRIVMPNGAIRWINYKAIPILDKNTLIGIKGVIVDVTNRKYADEMLQNSLKETRDYKHALDESSIVAITDQKGIITYVNNNFCKISKYKYEELIGQDYRIINSGYHSKDFFKEMYRAISHGELWHEEIKNQAKDGTFYWVATTIVPFVNEEGKPYQYIDVRSDITEQKILEEKLIEYQQKLEIKVEERTKDLVHKEQRLEMQNRELHKTNSELDRFVYSASHDLRAPLKSMIGLINITIDAEEPENMDQIERLEMISKSVLKLDDFIGDILDYSRNARVIIDNEEINFEEKIQEIRNSFKFIEGVAEINFQVEIHLKEKFISDKLRMKMILNNLISNAIKYKDISKDASFVNVIVECNKENAFITIEDNGIGIAEDKQGKIFEMFYRGTKLSNGSGLGLYIVKETVDKLGGRITLESELNKGTKFMIQLPNQLKLV